MTASLDSTQAAMADFAGQMPERWPARSSMRPARIPGRSPATPTCCCTWTRPTATRRRSWSHFINWALGDAGTKFATDLNYVPLPDSVKAKVLAKVGQITCNGAPLT